jgi:uncharacterized protein (TIGR02301 family)
VGGLMLHTPAAIEGYRRAMRFLAASLALVLLALPAAAQTPERAPPPRPGAAGYSDQLSELAEVLGGSHYLRILCSGRSDQRWRDYMRGIIQREPNFNAVLVEGFNRGYRNEEARFPNCDRGATQMEAELRARGVRIADGLRARHGE